MDPEIKTTKEIINDELGVILNSVDYDVNNALFEINKNKKWIGFQNELEFLESLLTQGLATDNTPTYDKITKRIELLKNS